MDEGEDTGPIIAQAAYPIWPDDTLDLIKRRGLELEYILYSQCIQWVAQRDLQLVVNEKGQSQVRILDPEYPRFLERLTRKAFAR